MAGFLLIGIPAETDRHAASEKELITSYLRKDEPVIYSARVNGELVSAES